MLILSPALMGQASQKFERALPATSDWSQHHLIFSKPATPEQAKLAERDPRYRQQLRRALPARLHEAEVGGGLSLEVQSSIDDLRRSRNRGVDGLWSEDMGSGATVGAVNYPAKVSFNPNLVSCANDFVVYGTGLTGTAGVEADIVAYSNLYSGCGGTVPSAYWAYNTNGGTVTTSPMFSADGTQVAFTQTDGSGNGNLVLLKWAASDGTVGSPHTLARTRSSNYFTCAAACMTSFVLRDSGGILHPDSNSSVFYDYTDDTAYVGDDGGWLHKFTPVFNGRPAEVRTGGWPVQVNTGSPTALTSPVHDYTSGNVFVADVGGFLYGVTPGAGVTVSGQLDFSAAEGGAGIVQGPIVDSTSELVYVFASSDGSGSCGGADCAAVYQLGVGFGGGTTGSKATVGNSTVSGSAPNPLYIGAFDSTYENSLNATGNLYVCGNTGGPPTLYQVPITAGAFGAANAGPVLSSTIAGTPCSPVTDILNPNASGGAAEWIFASAETGGISSGCSGGCIFNFKDTPWQPSTVYTVGQEILDNHFQIQVVSVGGTSGGTIPAWTTTAGQVTTDGGVSWVDQGVQSASTPGTWQKHLSYIEGSRIFDSNGNVQLATTGGTSGNSKPTFNPLVGGTTHDGGVTWTNVGVSATDALAAAGGTSGIIIDNIVGAGTEGGASQVYFSTLSDQTCSTSGGTGGCAVQASQSALK
jgi:hypothetical protein